MTTRIVDGGQVDQLRAFTNRDALVRLDKRGFRVSDATVFNRVATWVRAHIGRGSTRRSVTDVRDRFIEAIANRHGESGRHAASAALGERPGKTLNTRDIRQVFQALDNLQYTPDPSAANASERSNPASKAAHSAATTPALTDATHGAEPFKIMTISTDKARSVNPPSPDAVPEGGRFYRELQSTGSGLCTMHAMNAFCGGAVIGAKEYGTHAIEATLDALGVQGKERVALREMLKNDFGVDPNMTTQVMKALAAQGRIDARCAHTTTLNGVNIASENAPPRPNALTTEQINAFPGDRLMVGYSGGHGGDAHMVALRREEGGTWQILNSLQSVHGKPLRHATLAECLSKLGAGKGLNIVHVEEGFDFNAPAKTPNAADPPRTRTAPSEPLALAQNTQPSMAMQHGPAFGESSALDLPEPAYNEAELAALNREAQGATAAPHDGAPTNPYLVIVAAQNPAGTPGAGLPPPAYNEAELGALAQGGKSTSGSTLDEASQARYHDQGFSNEEARTLFEAGLDPFRGKTLREGLAKRGETLADALGSGIGLRQLLEVQQYGLGLRHAQAFERVGADAVTAASVYAHHQVPIDSDTMLARGDGALTGPLKKFGAGAMNTVYEANYTDGTQRIFKPLKPPDPGRTKSVEHGWVALETGVDAFHPRTAERNIATCAIDKALGFNVTPHTTIGIHKVGNEAPTLGLVMERAPGRIGADWTDPPGAFTAAAIERELTKLQLLDCITAQGDRHSSNYLIDVTPDGRARVTGIDNDQAFGPKANDPDGLRYIAGDHSRRGFRGCGLPPVIDTEMAAAVMQLDAAGVRGAIAGKLPEPELAATVQRLEATQAHVVELQRTGQLIDPNEWGRATPNADDSNSYFIRDQRRMAAAQAKNAALAMF